MNGQVDQFLVIGKDTEDRSRNKEHREPQKDIDDQAADEDEADAFGDTLILLRAVVIAHDILSRGGNSAVRKTHDLSNRIRQAHRADIERTELAAEAFEHDVYDRLRHTGRDLKRKSGRAEFDESRELFSVDEKTLQAKRRPFASKEDNDPQGARALGNDRRESRAFDAHIEYEDEERVERDIQDGAENNGGHTDLRKALRRDERVHAEADQHGDRADDVDAEIVDCVGKRGFVTAEDLEDPGSDGKKSHGQDRADDQKKRKGSRHHALCFSVFMLASGDRGKCSTACAAEVGKRADEGDQREAHAKARDSESSGLAHVADISSVDDVIEYNDQLGQHDRKTEF